MAVEVNRSPKPTQGADSAALEATLFQALPGFTWCGACGSPTRVITEPEARAVLGLLYEFSGSALDALDAASWFMEMYARHRYRGTCGCPPARVPVPNQGFCLYRLWTTDQRLLYVGVSTRLSARLRTHRRKLGKLFSYATWEEHPDAESMLAAETQAIVDELPVLNKAGVG